MFSTLPQNLPSAFLGPFTNGKTDLSTLSYSLAWKRYAIRNVTDGASFLGHSVGSTLSQVPGARKPEFNHSGPLRFSSNLFSYSGQKRSARLSIEHLIFKGMNTVRDDEFLEMILSFV